MTQADQNSAIRSQEIQELLGKSPGCGARFGTLALSLIILVILVAMTLVRVSHSVKIPVSIYVQARSQEIHSDFNARIDCLLVKDQELVQKGQAIMYLKNIANPEDVLALIAQLDTLTVANLKLANFPRELNLGSLELAYSNFMKALQGLSDSGSGSSALNPDLHALLNELTKKNSNLEAQSKMCAATENSLYQQYLDKLDLFYKGSISLEDVDNAIASFNEKKASCEALNGAMNTVGNEIQQVKAQIAASTQQQAPSTSSSEKSTLLELNELKMALVEWQQKYIISSPLAGTIHFYSNLSNQDSIQTNEVLFNISQEGNAIEVLAYFKKEMLSTIQLGQEFNIIIDTNDLTTIKWLPVVVAELPAACEEASCSVKMNIATDRISIDIPSLSKSEFFTFTGYIEYTVSRKPLLHTLFQHLLLLVQNDQLQLNN